jgi:hypothetical protein
VALDGPRAKVTEEPTISVSGRVVGGAATSVFFRVNDSSQEVPMDQRRFQASISLTPGPNRITAVAVGPDGLEAEDTVTVDYTPKVVSGGIILSSPPNGLILGPDDAPAVIVEGKTEDLAIDRIWVVVNDRAIEVPVRDGRFRRVVPAFGPVLKLWAESRPSNGAVRRSSVVEVAAPESGPTALLVLDWTNGASATQADVRAGWRSAPERIDGPTAAVSVRSIPNSSSNSGVEAVYLRNFKPGVYTFTARLIPPGSTSSVRPIVYLSSGGPGAQRVLETVTLDSKGRRVLARILLPHGLLWEDDGWTGEAESTDTMTKFRAQDGITWVERKADLR